MPLPTGHPQTVNLYRHATPPEFSGKRSEFRDFASGLRIYFDLNRRSFTGDEEKVLFTMSRLQGEARKFMMPNYDLYLQDKRLVPWFGVHEAFMKKLEEMYGDADMVAMAKRQIRGLKQTHGVQAYSTSFQTHAANLQSWGEAALCAQYYYSLKNDIKDEITCVGRPTKLVEIMELVHRLDRRWYERAQEKKTPKEATRDNRQRNHWGKTPGPTAPNPAPQPRPPVPFADRMEVDATVVSKDKVKDKAAFRAYCRKNDRCFNCGEEGYKQPSCTKPKASIASTKTKKRKYEYDSDLENE